MAHAYNPRYSGDRDQEDCSSKPAQAKVHETLSQKKHITKIRLMERLKVKALRSKRERERMAFCSE
jgi:hypothetical protein